MKCEGRSYLAALELPWPLTGALPLVAVMMVYVLKIKNVRVAGVQRDAARFGGEGIQAAQRALVVDLKGETGPKLRRINSAAGRRRQVERKEVGNGGNVQGSGEEEVPKKMPDGSLRAGEEKREEERKKEGKRRRKSVFFCP